MVYLVVIFTVLVLLVLAVMLMPIRISIDSSADDYSVSLGGLAGCRLVLVHDKLFIDIKFLFWKNRIDPFAQRPEKRRVDSKVKRKKESEKTVGMSLRQVKAVIRSFRVRRFLIRFNSGDMPLNGLLYPLFYGLSAATKKDIGIVFYGKSVVKIDIENNLARIALAYLKAK